MNQLHLLPMLGNSWEEIVTVAIGLVIVVGSAVANALKQQREKRTRLDQELGSRGGGGDQPIELKDEDLAGSSASRAEMLAQRRRAQLQELARQRASQSGGAPAGGAAAGSSGRTLYERRAEALRRAQQQTPERGGVGELERQREAAYQRAKAEAQRRARLEQARQQAQAQAQARAAQEARQAELSRVRQAELAAERARVEREAQRQRQRSDREAHLSHVADEHQPGAVTRAAADSQPGQPGSLAAALRGGSLRRAIVLKELLDPPVGMRKPDQPQWE